MMHICFASDLPLSITDENKCPNALDSKSAELFYQVTSGVLQGCPLSGSLFSLSADGFLGMRALILQPRKETVRAAADNIATVSLWMAMHACLWLAMPAAMPKSRKKN